MLTIPITYNYPTRRISNVELKELSKDAYNAGLKRFMVCFLVHSIPVPGHTRVLCLGHYRLGHMSLAFHVTNKLTSLLSIPPPQSCAQPPAATHCFADA